MQACPKCHHVRQSKETAPSWQCPACGVAYAKVAEAAHAKVLAASHRALSQTPAQQQPASSHFRWLRFIGVVALVLLGAVVFKQVQGNGVANWFDFLKASQSVSGADRMAALAANVKQGDVTMYTTTECTYCGQAKAWLRKHGFAFTECNMTLESRCEREFVRYGADGTPFLVVRGYQMKNGFDSNEFLEALAK